MIDFIETHVEFILELSDWQRYSILTVGIASRITKPGWSCYRMGPIPRPKGFPIEWKKHMKELKNKFDMGFNEINHKIDMKVKKDCQVIISPLVQSNSWNCY
jgi:hypothetical protein